MPEEVLGGRIVPNLNLSSFFLPGEHEWNLKVSNNFLWLSVLCQGVALGKTDSLGAPVGNQVWILDETALDQPNKIAVSDYGGVEGLEPIWKYITPNEGWLIFNQDTGYFERFTGAEWIRFDPNSHFKGPFDASAEPEYPAAEAGDTYVTTFGGKVGGSEGKVVREGDLIICVETNIGGIEEDIGGAWVVPTRWMKGVLNLISEPEYPAGVFGDGWFTLFTDKLGGPEGIYVPSGSFIMANQDNGGGTQEEVGFNGWTMFPRGAAHKAGTISGAAEEDYPRAVAGQFFIATSSGKVGGPAGKTVNENDWVWATSDNDGGSEAAVGGNWSIVPISLVLSNNALDDLSDVDAPTPEVGDTIIWDDSAAAYVNINLGDAILDTLLATLLPGAGIDFDTDEYGVTTINVEFATTPEIISGLEDEKAMAPSQWENAYINVPIAYAANIELDFSLYKQITIGNLTGDLTLDNPVNGNLGKHGNIFLKQDGTGGRTLTLASNWELLSGSLNLAPDATSVLNYYCRGAFEVVCWFSNNDSDNVATVTIAVSDPNGSVLTTGDGKRYYPIPSTLNGMNLISAKGYVTTVSSSGSITVQVHNATQAADMLSSLITITASSTFDAGVVDGANDDVVTGDIIRIDVDGAGTDTQGLIVELQFARP